MTTKKNADMAGASVSDEPAPLDLHELYHQQSERGYTRTLTLYPCQVQSIAARLRGITAITAVLIAGDDSETLELGSWIRPGLIEAVHALARNATSTLYSANESAIKEGGAA